MVNARRATAALAGAVALLGTLLTPAVAQATPEVTSTPHSDAVRAPAPAPAVRGFIDAIQAGPGWIRVTGWSFDPRRPAVSNSENVVIDGRMAALPVADRPRADLNAARRLTGQHGFDVAVAARAGAHRVCVVSRPVAGSGSTWLVLGCRTVRVPSSPARA